MGPPGGVRRFPAGFAWGVATSAAQIEGGVDLDGKGPSIWDTFCRTPGRTRDGADLDVAADHRRRMPADVELLSALGIAAYRFSIAWTRVQPSGRGPLSEPGLDFYRRLVDELLARGVEPVVTLYHWDLPQTLEDLGGWPVRETAARFADYAGAVGAALGDRVRHWSTINEPWCASMLGYAAGLHAPGRTEPAAAVAASHHLLLAHGMAVDALRAVVRPDAELAITLNPYPVRVVGDRLEDHDAARRVDGVANRLWYDAVLEGRYPEDVLADFAAVSELDHIRDGDLALIGRPIDAVGVNYYRRYHVRHRAGASRDGTAAVWPGSPDVELVPPDLPVTDGGWAIEPDGLAEALVEVKEAYRSMPLYVHESGCAFEDEPGPDGEVEDLRRIDYLAAHLRAVHDAMASGADVRGFFVWSLLDNFEWAEGYTHRFGIVHVEFSDGVRTPKASARWYGAVATRGAVPPG